MRAGQAMRGVVPVALVAAAVAASAPAAGAAVPAPSITASPATGVADGQTVVLTATNLYGSGQGVPAYECAGGQFPASFTFSDSTRLAVTDAVNRFCTYLGQIPASTTATSTGSFVVTRSFESFNGSPQQCGAPNPDCVVLAVGSTNGTPAYGLASTSITFAAPK